MKTFAIKLLCYGLRFYFQYLPIRRGKSYIWRNIVLRYILWRRLAVFARLRFGAVIEGRFPNLLHAYAFFFGVWEPVVTEYYKSVLRPGDVVIDIGANVGIHSLLASRLVGNAGKVHAIEASATIFRQLLRNISRNAAVNVAAYNFAVIDRTEPVEVYFAEDASAMTSILPSMAPGSSKSIVLGRPLTKIISIEDICAARLIKIDVEGAEWLVVKGILSALPLLKPDAQILIEVTSEALKEFGVSAHEFIDVFVKQGFAPWLVPNDYSVEFYLAKHALKIVPLADVNFERADIVFRKATS